VEARTLSRSAGAPAESLGTASEPGSAPAGAGELYRTRYSRSEGERYCRATSTLSGAESRATLLPLRPLPGPAEPFGRSMLTAPFSLWVPLEMSIAFCLRSDGPGSSLRCSEERIRCPVRAKDPTGPRARKRRKTKAQERVLGFKNNSPATSYSPTRSTSKYHRGWRA
jgi:hypothetical protein